MPGLSENLPAQQQQTKEEKYEETKVILQAVVSVYADSKDQELVRGAGRSLGQLQNLIDGARNNETVNIIRGKRTHPRPNGAMCADYNLPLWRQSLRVRPSAGNSSLQTGRRLQWWQLIRMSWRASAVVWNRA